MQYGGFPAQYAADFIEADHEARKELPRVSFSFTSIDFFESMLPASMLASGRRVHFNYSTPGGLSADDSIAKKSKFAKLRVRRFVRSDYQVRTDGSVDLDKASGGAALVYDQNKLYRKAGSVAGSLAYSYRAKSIVVEGGLHAILRLISAKHPV